MFDIQPLIDQVTAIKGVEDSALAWINGSAQRTTDAVNAAIANGATPAQLAPLTNLIADTKTQADAIAAAIAANAPAAPAAAAGDQAAGTTNS